LFPPDAPPFEEPWQARLFAMTVSVGERGLFGWSEWTRALAEAVAAAPEEAHFQVWLRTLESVLIAKGAASGERLRDLAEAWRAAAEATPHGRPIVLR
jgi:nitrile hydratase accessory protein